MVNPLLSDQKKVDPKTAPLYIHECHPKGRLHSEILCDSALSASTPDLEFSVRVRVRFAAPI